MTLNAKTLDDFFGGHEALKMLVKQPFSVTETNEKFDVLATLHGGGVAAQAGALRHGISRALCLFNLELRGKLKKAGFLTRDARVKERKKYGQKGARRRFQFSKRGSRALRGRKALVPRRLGAEASERHCGPR